MRISLGSILSAGCDHVWSDLIAAGQVRGNTLIIEDYIARPIMAKCEGELIVIAEQTARPLQAKITVRTSAQDNVRLAMPLPRQEWPMAISLMANLAGPNDAGMGDVIERIVGPIGGITFQTWYRKITGKDCGCGARKQWLNERYPLN